MSRTVAALVREAADRVPDAVAYVDAAGELTWSGYDRAADRLAAQLVDTGLGVGDRVLVQLPDGADVHIAYLACERAGLVIVGVADRSAPHDVGQAAARTRAAMVLTAAVDPVSGASGPPTPRRATFSRSTGLEYGGRAVPPMGPPPGASSWPSATALWLVNSTSGTTGRPKFVTQTQVKWLHCADQAVAAARITADDVVMSVVPSPYGFGLWSAHVLPATVAGTCVLAGRFDATAALELVERHRVTVLACVTTQFVMMLNSPAVRTADLSSLRVLWTGGERVPEARAREWERRTGSRVLQIYGSNEVGAFSLTSLADSDERRLTTVGRVVADGDVRLHDTPGGHGTSTGVGQPAIRSDATVGAGYWEDDAANEALRGPGGRLLMPDVVCIDDDGYVRITGRASDLIIRGGRNISALVVEERVAEHPAVDLVAAVPVPDPVFGERIGVVVTLRDGCSSLDLDDLLAVLRAQDRGPETLPERLAVIDRMPMSPGGKIAKAALRDRVTTWDRSG